MAIVSEIAQQVDQKPKIGHRSELLHPTTWWLTGLLLAVFAGLSTNWIVLLATSALAVSAIALFREIENRRFSLRFYLILALAIILIRLVFRVIFNFSDGADDVVLRLPEIEITLGSLGGVRLFGAVSGESLFQAATDGLRLAAIVLSVGMANSLADPRKLLKSTPGVLYEIATSIAIALNLAPQIIESLKRVLSARKLRGASRGLGALAGIVIPVLEDTVDKSLALAASMDARGFGRDAGVSILQKQISRMASLVGLLSVAFGIFLLLLSSQTQTWGIVAMVSGIALIALSLWVSSRGRARSTYRKQPKTIADAAAIVSVAGLVATALLGWWPA